MTITKRFWSKVKKTDGCWIWTGAKDRDGYGRFWKEKGLVGAHRYAYEEAVGPIPSGLVTDHSCHNPPCVNPSHIEPVTQAENNRRHPEKTHCPKGHPYNTKNTYVGKKGSKECRTCHRLQSNLYNSKKNPDPWRERIRARYEVLRQEAEARQKSRLF